MKENEQLCKNNEANINVSANGIVFSFVCFVIQLSHFLSGGKEKSFPSVTSVRAVRVIPYFHP